MPRWREGEDGVEIYTTDERRPDDDRRTVTGRAAGGQKARAKGDGKPAARSVHSEKEKRGMRTRKGGYNKSLPWL
jgi:hypothetical protein